MSYPIVEWVRQNNIINTVVNEFTPNIVTDSFGNTYGIYSTDRSVSGQNTTGLQDVVVFKIDYTGSVIWTRQNSIINTVSFDQRPSICVASSGNLYISFQTRGSTSGNSNLGGPRDIVVMKMNPSGDVVWIKQNSSFNTTANDYQPEITVDTNENIYVTYFTEGTTSGQSLIGGQDVVLFKMNRDGIVQWIEQNNIMNTVNTDDFPFVTTDYDGNILIAYSTLGTASGQTLTGGIDIVILKFDPTGSVLWIRQNSIFNTIVDDFSTTVITHSIGNIYVTYATSGTTSGNTSTGNEDIVVLKMNTDGTVLWIRQNSLMNTNANSRVPSATIDKYDNLYVSYSTIGTSSGQINTGGQDIVVFKMNSEGDVQWIRQNSFMNTSLDDVIPSVSIDQYGNIYVAYITLGGTASGQSLIGGQDVVIFKLRQSPANNFCALLQDYITLGPTLVFTEEYVLALRDNKPLPGTALVSWIQPQGLIADVPLRDLKKTVVIMQGRLHSYYFRKIQLINGIASEGVGGSVSDVDAYKCGYICTWAASGLAYIP